MSYLTELYTSYSVNRPLTQQEKTDQLHQGKQHCESKFIRDRDAVIKMNSTYLEIIAMRTSKIPQWTKEVEKACLISPNDTVDVSYKNNIPDL
ncbi:hypothetical protein [Xenorhabdus entomophaga]|uniref:hypothetical protein n=1 Tax=Xenorhabdus entomophaga TaxID=3136257 RepID=UPI0030F3E128